MDQPSAQIPGGMVTESEEKPAECTTPASAKRRGGGRRSKGPSMPAEIPSDIDTAMAGVEVIPRKYTRSNAEALLSYTGWDPTGYNVGSTPESFPCGTLLAVLLSDAKRRRETWTVGQVTAQRGDEYELYDPLTMRLDRITLNSEEENVQHPKKRRTKESDKQMAPKAEIASDQAVVVALVGGTPNPASPTEGQPSNTEADAIVGESGSGSSSSTEKSNVPPPLENAQQSATEVSAPTDGDPAGDWYPVRTIAIGVLLSLYHQGCILGSNFIYKPATVKETTIRRGAQHHWQLFLQALRRYLKPDDDRSRQTLALTEQAQHVLEEIKQADPVDTMSPKGRAMWLPMDRLVREIYALNGLPIVVPGSFEEEQDNRQDNAETSSLPSMASPTRRSLQTPPKATGHSSSKAQRSHSSNLPRSTSSQPVEKSPATPRRRKASNGTPLTPATPASDPRTRSTKTATPSAPSQPPLPPPPPPALMNSSEAKASQESSTEVSLEQQRLQLLKLLFPCQFLRSPYQGSSLGAQQLGRVIECLEILQQELGTLDISLPPTGCDQKEWHHIVSETKGRLKAALAPKAQQDRGLLLQALQPLAEKLGQVVDAIEGIVSNDAARQSLRTKCIPDKLTTHLKTLYETALQGQSWGPGSTVVPAEFIEYLWRYGIEMRDQLLTALMTWQTWMPPFTIDVTEFMTLLELLLLNGLIPRGTAPCKAYSAHRATVALLLDLYKVVHTMQAKHPQLFPSPRMPHSKRRPDQPSGMPPSKQPKLEHDIDTTEQTTQSSHASTGHPSKGSHRKHPRDTEPPTSTKKPHKSKDSPPATETEVSQLKGLDEKSDQLCSESQHSDMSCQPTFPNPSDNPLTPTSQPLDDSACKIPSSKDTSQDVIGVPADTALPLSDTVHNDGTMQLTEVVGSPASQPGATVDISEIPAMPFSSIEQPAQSETQPTEPDEPETQPLSQPETQLPAQVEVQPLSQPETQLLVQPETQPLVQPEAQPPVQPETQPLSQPEAQPPVQPETKPSVQPETQPLSQPETQLPAQADAQPLPQPEAQLPVQPEAQPLSQPEAWPLEPAPLETQPLEAAHLETHSPEPAQPEIQLQELSQPETQPREPAQSEIHTAVERSAHMQSHPSDSQPIQDAEESILTVATETSEKGLESQGKSETQAVPMLEPLANVEAPSSTPQICVAEAEALAPTSPTDRVPPADNQLVPEATSGAVENEMMVQEEEIQSVSIVQDKENEETQDAAGLTSSGSVATVAPNSKGMPPLATAEERVW